MLFRSGTLVRLDDRGFADWLLAATEGGPGAALAAGLFGPTRSLVKRVATFDAVHHPEIHGALAGRAYGDSASIAGNLARRLSRRGVPVVGATLLIDAPPVEREVEFRLDVLDRTRDTGESEPGFLPLGELSPVVRALAREQFDDLVKRVRVFAPAEAARAIRALPGGVLPDLRAAIEDGEIGRAHV